MALVSLVPVDAVSIRNLAAAAVGRAPGGFEAYNVPRPLGVPGDCVDHGGGGPPSHDVLDDACGNLLVLDVDQHEALGAPTFVVVEAARDAAPHEQPRRVCCRLVVVPCAIRAAFTLGHGEFDGVIASATMCELLYPAAAGGEDVPLLAAVAGFDAATPAREVAITVSVAREMEVEDARAAVAARLADAVSAAEDAAAKASAASYDHHDDDQRYDGSADGCAVILGERFAVPFATGSRARAGTCWMREASVVDTVPAGAVVAVDSRTLVRIDVAVDPSLMDLAGTPTRGDSASPTASPTGSARLSSALPLTPRRGGSLTAASPASPVRIVSPVVGNNSAAVGARHGSPREDSRILAHRAVASLASLAGSISPIAPSPYHRLGHHGERYESPHHSHQHQDSEQHASVFSPFASVSAASPVPRTHQDPTVAAGTSTFSRRWTPTGARGANLVASPSPAHRHQTATAPPGQRGGGVATTPTGHHKPNQANTPHYFVQSPDVRTTRLLQEPLAVSRLDSPPTDVRDHQSRVSPILHQRTTPRAATAGGTARGHGSPVSPGSFTELRFDESGRATSVDHQASPGGPPSAPSPPPPPPPPPHARHHISAATAAITPARGGADPVSLSTEHRSGLPPRMHTSSPALALSGSRGGGQSSRRSNNHHTDISFTADASSVNSAALTPTSAAASRVVVDAIPVATPARGLDLLPPPSSPPPLQTWLGGSPVAAVRTPGGPPPTFVSRTPQHTTSRFVGESQHAPTPGGPPPPAWSPPPETYGGYAHVSPPQRHTGSGAMSPVAPLSSPYDNGHESRQRAESEHTATATARESLRRAVVRSVEDYCQLRCQTTVALAKDCAGRPVLLSSSSQSSGEPTERGVADVLGELQKVLATCAAAHNDGVRFLCGGCDSAKDVTARIASGAQQITAAMPLTGAATDRGLALCLVNVPVSTPLHGIALALERRDIHVVALWRAEATGIVYAAHTAATRHAASLLVQRSRFLSLKEIDPNFSSFNTAAETTTTTPVAVRTTAVEVVQLEHSILDDLCRVAELEARRYVRMHAECKARVDFGWLLESHFASLAQLHGGVVDAAAEGADALDGAGEAELRAHLASLGIANGARVVDRTLKDLDAALSAAIRASPPEATTTAETLLTVPAVGAAVEAAHGAAARMLESADAALTEHPVALRGSASAPAVAVLRCLEGRLRGSLDDVDRVASLYESVVLRAESSVLSRLCVRVPLPASATGRGVARVHDGFPALGAFLRVTRAAAGLGMAGGASASRALARVSADPQQQQQLRSGSSAHEEREHARVLAESVRQSVGRPGDCLGLIDVASIRSI